MTTTRDLINPVDQPILQPPPGGGTKRSPKEDQIAKLRRQETTLQEAKARKASLRVPGYVPEGYSLSRVTVHDSASIVNGPVVDLTYFGPAGERLRISQGGAVKPGGIDVKTGSYEAVTFAGGLLSGYFVNGSWVIGVQPPGHGGTFQWLTDFSLLLIYEDDGELIRMSTGPTAEKPLSREDLIKVAESLRP